MKAYERIERDAERLAVLLGPSFEVAPWVGCDYRVRLLGAGFDLSVCMKRRRWRAGLRLHADPGIGGGWWFGVRTSGYQGRGWLHHLAVDLDEACRRALEIEIERCEAKILGDDPEAAGERLAVLRPVRAVLGAPARLWRYQWEATTTGGRW